MSKNIDLSAKLAQLSPQQRELLKAKLAQLNNHSQELTLSYSQQRIWFLHELETDNPIYNRPTNFELLVKLNIEILEKSLNQIIERHQVFRTVFISENGIPKLNILPEFHLNLSITNLENIDKNEQNNQLKVIAKQEAQQIFDLTKLPLIRTNLVRLNQQHHILFITIHHIIFDGLSAEIFLKELTSFYQSNSQSQSPSLPNLSIQYQDFAKSQKQLLAGVKLQNQLSYWREKLGGELPILQLPFDYPRGKETTFEGATHSLILSKSLAKSLKSLSQREGVTLFMTLLTAFKILLYRYTAQEDIIIGSPIGGRDKREFEDLIGVFINTLVFRTPLNDSLTFRQLLNQVKQTALEAYSNKDIPFEKLVEELQPERNLNINSIFQVFFQLRSFVNQQVILPDLIINKYEIETGIVPFDLSLDITEIEEGLLCKFSYKKELFSQETIKRISDNFQVLLKGIIDYPDEKIALLPLLTASEKQQVLIDWNNTYFDYPKDKCIHQLFEEQVSKTPDNIAIVFEEEKLSYQQLNEKANELAHYLQELGVKKGSFIGIFLVRSPLIIISMLAILKVGCAYVPLDINYPQERIKFMVEDANIPLIISEAKLENKLPIYQGNIIKLDGDEKQIIKQCKENLEVKINSDNLAYLIYTSGSTGKPKGVQIPHQNVINLLTFISDKLSVNSQEIFLSLASFSFDISVAEIFIPLINGSQLILTRDEDIKDGNKLTQIIKNNQVTVIDATPATWKLLELVNWQNNQKIKLISTGEKLSSSLAHYLMSQSNSVWNFYGPTETTIWSLIYPVINPEKILIGKPIANTQTYILDKNLQPLPIGIIGELYIGGDGLARGYLNRPDLTAEKFIDNPFDSGKLYKTGDLCRYLPDGNIEFIARKDEQVKIRGFRLELGEIENNLLQYPHIKETVVITLENEKKDKYLVAYIISDESINVKEIREYLASKLPDYMIPSAFVFLDKFPLTPNGKIDKKALPKPDFESNRENEFIAPRNDIEMKLAQIWQEALNIEKIGINDNFFALGGHSLLATQIVSRIRTNFMVELPLRNLFEYPTIAQLCDRISQFTIMEMGEI